MEYNIQILAYTRLGDGSLSFPPVRAQTFEDTPGKPSNVSFPDVTYTMGMFKILIFKKIGMKFLRTVTFSKRFNQKILYGTKWKMKHSRLKF